MRLLRNPYIGSFLSALLTVAAFPPWDFSFLIWFSLVPLLLVEEKPVRAAALHGFWMSLGGFYWVAVVIHEFGGAPWPVAVIALLAFCSFNQLPFVLWRWLAPKLGIEFANRSPSAREAFLNVAWLTLVYTAIDWLYPKLFLDTLGHALYRDTHLRQMADVGGASLLTFAIVASNVALAHSIRHRSRLLLVAPVAALFTLGTYGVLRLRALRPALDAPSARALVGVVQPNIGDIEKLAAENGLRMASKRVLKTMTELSEEALRQTPRPDAILWPETAFPSAFRAPLTATELDNEQQIDRFVQRNQVPLWFGGYDSENGVDYNALFFLSPFREGGLNGRENLATYRKNILLLFGEYIPGAGTFDFIKKAFPQVGNFGLGVGPVTLDLELANATRSHVKLAPVICYEALFPYYTRAGVNQGAQAILNVTNDSWFGAHGEPQLHLALTTFRSIETRVPQLRSTNTGITALIDATGAIVDAGPIGRPWVRSYSLDLTAPIWTPFKAFGEWFGMGCVGLSALFAMRRLWLKRSARDA